LSDNPKECVVCGQMKGSIPCIQCPNHICDECLKIQFLEDVPQALARRLIKRLKPEQEEEEEEMKRAEEEQEEIRERIRFSRIPQTDLLYGNEKSNSKKRSEARLASEFPSSHTPFIYFHRYYCMRFNRIRNPKVKQGEQPLFLRNLVNEMDLEEEEEEKKK